MKKGRKVSKKALMTALAFTIGSGVSASALDKAGSDPLLSLNELGSSTTLIAHEGKCGEGKCGEGKCGEAKAASKRYATGECKTEKKDGKFEKKDGKCVEHKCGESKCGEGKCGTDK